jgi:hypothetical protein
MLQSPGFFLKTLIPKTHSRHFTGVYRFLLHCSMIWDREWATDSHHFHFIVLSVVLIYWLYGFSNPFVNFKQIPLLLITLAWWKACPVSTIKLGLPIIGPGITFQCYLNKLCKYCLWFLLLVWCSITVPFNILQLISESMNYRPWVLENPCISTQGLHMVVKTAMTPDQYTSPTYSPVYNLVFAIRVPSH